MGNVVSEADSYTEDYSAYESSRLRADDNDTWDYSMEESRARIHPSESSSSHSEEETRGRHRSHRRSGKSRSPSPPPPRSPHKSPPVSPPHHRNTLRSFSDEDDPTSATYHTDMARRDRKLPHRYSRSSSPRQQHSPHSPRSPYASPRTMYRERRQPHYDSDDSSELEERDRRRLYRYGRDRSNDDYEYTPGDEDDDNDAGRMGSNYDDSHDEWEEERKYQESKRSTTYRQQQATKMQLRSTAGTKEELEEDGDDGEYVSITDVSVELNPNRKPPSPVPEPSLEEEEVEKETMKEVELIQLHEGQEDEVPWGSEQALSGSDIGHGKMSPQNLPSPIHLEHLPSPPISPQNYQYMQQHNQTVQSNQYPFYAMGQVNHFHRPNSPNHPQTGSSMMMMMPVPQAPNATNAASPQRILGVNGQMEQTDGVGGPFLMQLANQFVSNQSPKQNQIYTAVPIPQQQNPGSPRILHNNHQHHESSSPRQQNIASSRTIHNNYFEPTSPIPSVTAETYYGGSFQAVIDQSELYPELGADYVETDRPAQVAVVPTGTEAYEHDDDNDSRDPGGVHASDETVEHSLMTSPEEIMARNIIQARLRQALAKGLSFNESTEESQSIPSVSVKSPGTFDNNTESTGSFDDGDVEFVRQYEAVFDQFVNANLNLMARHPELIYNLRVAKLQKLFQLAADNEMEVEEKVQVIDAEKRQLLVNHKKELIEAARRKAALEIQLRQELGAIEQATLEVTGKMTWQLIVANITRASRHHQLIQNLSHTRVSRGILLEVLPSIPETQSIRTALAIPPGRRLTDKQQQEVRQLQVDNTFLRAEVSILEKKLAALQTNAKKYAWVDSIFVRMEPKHIKKLKHRFQKNLGVSF